MTTKQKATPEARRTAERDESQSQERSNPAMVARDAMIAERLEQMPKSCRAGYLRATRGEASPRQAIKSSCLECVGWERVEVRRCTDLGCPLWMYRPFKEDGQQ